MDLKEKPTANTSPYTKTRIAFIGTHFHSTSISFSSKRSAWLVAGGELRITTRSNIMVSAALGAPQSVWRSAPASEFNLGSHHDRTTLAACLASLMLDMAQMR